MIVENKKIEKFYSMEQSEASRNFHSKNGHETEHGTCKAKYSVYKTKYDNAKPPSVVVVKKEKKENSESVSHRHTENEKRIMFEISNRDLLETSFDRVDSDIKSFQIGKLI